MTVTALLVGVSFSVSAIFVYLVRWSALRAGVLDVPNQRSSHTRPTPRGGGAGLVAATLLVWLVWDRDARIEYAVLLAVVGVVAVAAIGWLDDRRGGLRPRTRMAVHVVSGILILPLASQASVTPLPAAIALGWWAFWVVASVNVVNFIDGIDGLIGSQSMLFGVHLAANAQGSARLLGLVLAGASAGFLFFNWAPAKIFLGDVGSGALGVLFVLGGALAIRSGSLTLVSVFLPLAPIFLDAAITLAARAARGERLSEAHRSHLYQRLANGGMGHARVTSLYAVASAAAVALVTSGLTISVLLLVLYLTGCAITGLALLRRVRSSAPA